MAQNEKEIVCCSGCGIEIDEAEGAVHFNNQPYCLWCWNNDCCRITRDATESRPNEKKGSDVL